MKETVFIHNITSGLLFHYDCTFVPHRIKKYELYLAIHFIFDSFYAFVLYSISIWLWIKRYCIRIHIDFDLYDEEVPISWFIYIQ